ncbi:MAG: asparagine synthase (glutamine-hydrolyzing) [Deltaproteobacteria bacterium]|nr:asparagine synthase (glutamine-hydrolyzing) [Deltaproteobacteria bacterium]
MCGIAGYFARDGIAEPEGRALLEKMGAAIRHRGPDGSGTLVDRHAGLASTRLAIIDLAGGAMPIANETERISVVSNGEIYDHPSHRAALEARGHRFRTRADTEVLVHLYEDHELDLASVLTGMFAFAIWDSERRRLLLARDRFGIKPLFVAEARGLLLFASEAKAILATGRIDPRLDPLALRDLGSAGYPMPPRTMFKNIRALPPGHLLCLEPDRPSTPRRWFVSPYGPEGRRALPPVPRGEAAAAESLRTLLEGVVRDHLLADVEVGSYLSGGLDSVTVAALAKLASERLHTFSMVFPEKDQRFDESSHSDLAAGAIGSEHHRVLQGPISFADYQGTLRAMEAPQVHTVGFCLYRLSRAVREAGLKVVLSGEGADEVFAGYGVFKLSRLRRGFFGRSPAIRRLASRWTLGRRQPELHASLSRWWALEPAVRARYGLVPPWIEQWWILSEAWREILSPEVAELIPRGIDALPDAPPAGALDQVQDGLHRDLVFEQASRLDGWVLALGDRLSMAHSIEVRVPFLDHRVVGLAAAVEPRLLLKGLREKHLLRQAAAGRIPEPLRARTKRAFVAPVRGWLFGEGAPDYARDLLSDASLAERKLLDPAGVRRALEAAGGEGRSIRALQASWALNLALGLEVFARSFDAAP